MLNVGDKVKVVYGTHDNQVAKGMFKYHGMVSKIIGTVHYTGYGADTYQLDGFVSPKGMHYEFLEEWLVLTEEREDGNDAEGSHTDVHA